MGKGSKRRPGNDKAYAEGWDRIFGQKSAPKEAEPEPSPVSDVILVESFAKNIVSTERSQAAQKQEFTDAPASNA